MTLELTEFLNRYRIDPERFERSGLSWDNLVEIYHDFSGLRPLYEPAAKDMADILRAPEAVHAVRMRLKDPGRLLAKIVRKSLDHDLQITRATYHREIQDLIGIRALHLFQSEWAAIHDFIRDNWAFHRPPEAWVKPGDSGRIVSAFWEKGCEIKEHDQGFRAVRYTVRCSPSDDAFLAEIHATTVFEEARSEIDHRMRQWETADTTLTHCAELFNRAASAADELGSALNSLEELLAEAMERDRQDTEAVNRTVRQLKEGIKVLDIDPGTKKTLEAALDTPSALAGNRHSVERDLGLIRVCRNLLIGSSNNVANSNSRNEVDGRKH